MRFTVSLLADYIFSYTTSKGGGRAYSIKRHDITTLPSLVLLVLSTARNNWHKVNICSSACFYYFFHPYHRMICNETILLKLIFLIFFDHYINSHAYSEYFGTLLIRYPTSGTLYQRMLENSINIVQLL